MKMKPLLLSLVATACLTAPFVATQAAEENTQFIPALVYRTGPYAAGGSGFFGGIEDYMSLLNLRDGGINGVKLVWEECETAYNSDRGVECYERLKNRPNNGGPVHPLSTGITYRLIERATTALGLFILNAVAAYSLAQTDFASAAGHWQHITWGVILAA